MKTHIESRMLKAAFKVASSDTARPILCQAAVWAKPSPIPGEMGDAWAAQPRLVAATDSYRLVLLWQNMTRDEAVTLLRDDPTVLIPSSAMLAIDKEPWAHVNEDQTQLTTPTVTVPLTHVIGRGGEFPKLHRLVPAISTPTKGHPGLYKKGDAIEPMLTPSRFSPKYLADLDKIATALGKHREPGRPLKEAGQMSWRIAFCAGSGRPMVFTAQHHHATSSVEVTDALYLLMPVGKD